MKKTIKIEIVNGIIDIKDIPRDVEIVVRDYDVEGLENINLTKDEDGFPCLISIWS